MCPCISFNYMFSLLQLSFFPPDQQDMCDLVAHCDRHFSRHAPLPSALLSLSLCLRARRSARMHREADRGPGGGGK